MKNIILTIVLSLTLCINISQAAPAVGSGFTYQGELLDNGTPANGDYDIKLDLYLNLTGGGSDGSLTFNNVTVTNGLFTIDDVDFGDAVYTDHNQFYVETAVQLAGGAGFDILTPRQRLAAVPYAVQAEFLAPGTASNGDVLQFDGINWVAETLINMSQWLISPGGTSLYTNERVGVGVTYPSAKLHVSAPVGENVFRVAQGNNIKLRVDPDNGGLSVGEAIVPPTDGIYVKGDAKQHSDGNGILKYMVTFYCAHDVPTATIVRYANNINDAAVTIAPGLDVGQCILTFPTDISQRYWQVSAITRSDASIAQNIGANCKEHGASGLVCTGVKLSNGNKWRTSMMLLVY